MTEPRLHYFKPAEFNRAGINYWPKMCPRLLVLMDVLRLQLGSAIHISAHDKAIGRTTGTSQHNYKRYGQVRALDFFVAHIDTRGAAEAVVDTMRKLGFTGIGVYPQWRNNSGVQQVGFHGDTREGPAGEWGYMDGQFVSLMKALPAVGK